MSQTFKVTVSPRERFYLALLLLHNKLKFKTKEEGKGLNRARKALGLVEISEAYLIANRDPGQLRIGPSAEDSKTRNVFEVTQDNADFILAQAEKLEKGPAEMLWLTDVLEQLDGKKDAADAGDVQPCDPATENWSPGSSILLENPTLTVAIMRELYEKHESFGAHRKAFLEASKPPDADPET
jgi:hypothetical protein